MRVMTNILVCCLALASFSSAASQDLVTKAQQENQQQKVLDSKRQAEFKQTEQALRKEKAELLRQRNQIQQQTDRLTKQFSTNETQLAKLQDKLRLQSGSLGELFGVVRQNAKELQADISHSVTSVDANKYSSVVSQIVAAKTLPSIKQLTGLWKSFEEQISASGQLAKVQVPFVEGDGQVKTVDAIRLGSFGLITNKGYVNWNAISREANAYIKQPSDGPTLSSLASLSIGQVQSVVIDPSKGEILNQLGEVPSMMQRLKQGGVVGEIIIALLVLGIVIAGIRGAYLFKVQKQISKQLKEPEAPTDNPLGRVLNVYHQEPNRSVEALELRLLEAIVDEQAHLEKGLSMLKLLAAIAPMLGLLGTVAGMIETFQVITQFGNGDPKVMAGGISMALVTTVLGLVSAIPLLLAHNVLSSQAEKVRTILEKQGLGIVAEQAERDSKGITPAKVQSPKSTVGNVA
ncbi:MotA/TolQ/ExbB proton channel family protein [Vibrio marisflavi]|uniref:Tol-Pal system protein TolQ n=1 Tax=Vibrio marisflavi CECT 7928 TaxID=634439 RepID=A0ABM9A488_9VIBR|nr:MotA/TolQ/ExbB proton channel family protein [Vibrio marisflavi]CAH0539655.1 Tol-Pal system protein TolQ [Vibrio marisflavi CECT 7928]